MDKNQNYTDVLVSIIVPIYNVEKYLSECIESVLAQSYKNLEIILVDDGSTDSSGEICDAYKRRNDRIQVIHKENGGLSDARNQGIVQSRGLYLAFVDSDDTIDSSYVEVMMRVMERYNCDIVQCAYQKIYNNGRKVLYGENSLIVNGREIQRYLYGKKSSPEAFDIACNKLYKSELFKEIRYPLNRIHEDIATTYKLYLKAHLIVVIPNVLYNYRIRKESISHQESLQSLQDWRKAEKERYDFYDQINIPEMKNVALKAYYYRTLACIKSKKITVEQKKELTYECKEIAKKILFSHTNTLRTKCGVLWTMLRNVVL